MQSLLQYREGIQSEHGSHTVLKTPNWAFIQRTQKRQEVPSEPNRGGCDPQPKKRKKKHGQFGSEELTSPLHKSQLSSISLDMQ